MISIKHHDHMHEWSEADELIKPSADLEDKLKQVREEVKIIGTSSALNKDQKELLRTHERRNVLLSTLNMQSM